MDLSVVTTLYRSAPFIQEFYERICAAAGKLTPEFEIILVNDGSPDDSLQRALQLCQQDSRVRVVDLSRNFGHHPAMMTGLRHALGQTIFLIDSDLEEDPEWLEKFDEVRRRADADVVFGVQDRRAGSLVHQWGARLFYKVFNLLSSDPLPEDLMTVRLMSRRYVDALLAHPEVELTIAGLWVRTGFHQVPVTVLKKQRKASSYGLARKIALFINGVTSFSNKPLTFIFYLGAVMVLMSLAAASWLVARRLLFGEMLSGWPSLILSIWLLSGLIIFCQGLIGIYLSKVFIETKRRPLTIVRQIYHFPAENTHERFHRAG